MKQIILTIIATLAISTTSFAQGEFNGQRPQRMDPTEMMERRLQEMKTNYNLTDEQVTAIKALNEKYFSFRGPRGGQRPEGNDSEKKEKKEKKVKKNEVEGDSIAPGAPKNNSEARRRGPRGGRFGQNMEEYNNELQKIMTADQYKAYQADMEKRRNERGPRGQFGPRN